MAASRPTDAIANTAAVPAALPAINSPAVTASAAQSKRPREAWWFLGPAFVASVAYMDPGNFATNIEGGARFGYQLLWVLLWSNAMAILVQYLSAKLGIATGKTLPENCRAHLFAPGDTCSLGRGGNCGDGHGPGGIFGRGAGILSCSSALPMLPAAILTGVVVMLILRIEQAGFQWLERVIMLFVGVIGVAYACEVFLSKPHWGADRHARGGAA